MALASRALGGSSGIVILLGVISGALFYGDAIITPALSVLSAVEGLKVVTPAFDSYVVPITVVILVALFSVAVARHRQGRRLLRSDHAGLVRSSHLPLPGSGTSDKTGRVAGIQSLLWGEFSASPRHHGILHPRGALFWW